MEKRTDLGHISVWQNETQRWLCIDNVEQSRINRNSPHQPESPVHKALLSFLLFMDAPRKMLLAGLGGGTLPGYLHHFDDKIKGDAVELNTTVADAALEYFNIPRRNWKIHINDIRDWNGNEYDMVMIDLAEGDETPEWLVSENMIQQLKQQMSSQSAIVLNILTEDADKFRNILLRLRKAFNRKVVCVGVPDHWNIIVIAFNGEPEYSAQQLEARCQLLNQVYKDDFSDLVKQIRKDNPAGSGVI